MRANNNSRRARCLLRVLCFVILILAHRRSTHEHTLCIYTFVLGARLPHPLFFLLLISRHHKLLPVKFFSCAMCCNFISCAMYNSLRCSINNSLSVPGECAMWIVSFCMHAEEGVSPFSVWAATHFSAQTSNARSIKYTMTFLNEKAAAFCSFLVISPTFRMHYAHVRVSRLESMCTERERWRTITFIMGLSKCMCAREEIIIFNTPLFCHVSSAVIPASGTAIIMRLGWKNLQI
jgi:hypothetical protein